MTTFLGTTSIRIVVEKLADGAAISESPIRSAHTFCPRARMVGLVHAPDS